MGNFIIAHPLLSDLATVTNNGEDASYPGTNLQRPQPSDVFRSDNLTPDPELTIDLGSAQTVRFVAILYTNATVDATVQILGNNVNSGWGTPNFDSGVLTHWSTSTLQDWTRTHFFYVNNDSTPPSERWWRITIDDSTNPFGYYEAGRLYISDPWQPPRGNDFGWQVELMDESTIQRSPNSQVYINRRNAYRRAKLSLSFSTESELYDNAFYIDRIRSSRDVVMVHDPDDVERRMDTAVYGILQSSPIINQTTNNFQKVFELEEMELP